ncbi:MAG TPA: hypothetical protein VFU72_11835 [Nitrolancea sp.]|nr:hypothetical protein [Nitrolancea sp.]
MLNLGPQPESFALIDPAGSGTIVLSTHLDRENQRVESELALRPNEGLILALD